MHAFNVHPQKKPEPAPPPVADEEKPPRRRRWLVALLLVLLIGGVTWAVRPNPHLARAKDLQKELFSPDAKNLPKEERKARFDAYRAEVKHLTDAQKRELTAPMREKRKADMDRYFTMSAKEKTKYLDDMIDRSEKAKKEREKQGKANGKANGGPPGGGPGGGGFGFGPGGGGPGGGGPGGKTLSPAEREQRRKQALDRTSPEERAQMDQFRRDLDNRRRQRGLPVTAR